jgi:hypothetical protein
MDQLEHEVREMLKQRAEKMPAEYEPSTELLGKASRRRTTKIVAMGATFAIVVAGIVGALATQTSKHRVDIAPATTPTTAAAPSKPVAYPILNTVACPVTFGVSGATNPFGAPKPEPRPTTAGDAPVFAGMDSYAAGGDATFVVAAPKGWHCQATIGADGASSMDVYPGSALTGEGPVHINYDWLWHGANGAGTACSVFQSQALLAYWAAAYPSLPCKVPAGRVVTGNDKMSTFTDSDGSIGVGFMSTPSSIAGDDGAVEILTCHASGGLNKAACQSIVADYAARNTDFSNPPTKTISRDGKIGGLQLGVSAQSVVVAVAGSPAATATGNFGAGFPSFRALGYDCTAASSDGRDPIVLQPTTHGPYCKTIYYVNATSNTLGGFSTTSNTFVTEKGTSVGMTEADAAKNEGQNSSAGCDTGISLGQPRTIFINVGTKPTDRVNRLSAELPKSALGVLFC